MQLLTRLWTAFRRESWKPGESVTTEYRKPARSAILPRNFRTRGRVRPDLNDQFELLDEDIVPKERTVPIAPPAAPLPGYKIIQKDGAYIITHEE